MDCNTILIIYGLCLQSHVLSKFIILEFMALQIQHNTVGLYASFNAAFRFIIGHFLFHKNVFITHI